MAYQTKSGKEKRGLCSNYLKAKKEGDEVVVGILKSKFRLPADSSAPIVMVGAGSGISPYFGFIEQRICILLLSPLLLPPPLLPSSPPLLLSSCLLSSSPPLLLSSSPPVLLSSCPPLLLSYSPPLLLSFSPPLLLSSSPPPLLSSALPALFCPRFPVTKNRQPDSGCKTGQSGPSTRMPVRTRFCKQGKNGSGLQSRNYLGFVACVLARSGRTAQARSRCSPGTYSERGRSGDVMLT